MKKINKGICSFALLFTCCNSVALAEIPKGTVVMGNRAFDLNYVNDPKNVQEIREWFFQSKDIKVKSFEGDWYDNLSGKRISNKKVPRVIYKDEKGAVEEYSERDGEKIELDVNSVHAIAPNKLKIRFNNKLDKDSILNKDNFKINNKGLTDKDSIAIEEDGQTVVVTFKEELNLNDTTNKFFISKNLVDANKNPIKNSYENEFLIISDSLTSVYKDINCNVNIIADNFTLKNIDIKGDLYIASDSVEIKNVSSDKLIIANDKRSSVLVSKSKINETLVISPVKFFVSDSSLGKTKVNIQDKNNTEAVELEGRYEDEIILQSDVKILAAKYLKMPKLKKLKIDPINSGAKIELHGTFMNIDFVKNAELTLGSDARVTNELKVLEGCKISSNKNAKVSNLILCPEGENEDINLSGNFEKITVENKCNASFGDDSKVKVLIVKNNINIKGNNTVKIDKAYVGENVSINEGVNGEEEQVKIAQTEPLASMNKPKGSSNHRRDNDNDDGDEEKEKPEKINVELQVEHFKPIFGIFTGSLKGDKTKNLTVEVWGNSLEQKLGEGISGEDGSFNIRVEDTDVLSDYSYRILDEKGNEILNKNFFE